MQKAVYSLSVQTISALVPPYALLVLFVPSSAASSKLLLRALLYGGMLAPASFHRQSHPASSTPQPLCASQASDRHLRGGSSCERCRDGLVRGTAHGLPMPFDTVVPLLCTCLDTCRTLPDCPGWKLC